MTPGADRFARPALLALAQAAVATTVPGLVPAQAEGVAGREANVGDGGGGVEVAVPAVRRLPVAVWTRSATRS